MTPLDDSGGPAKTGRRPAEPKPGGAPSGTEPIVRGRAWPVLGERRRRTPGPTRRSAKPRAGFRLPRIGFLDPDSSDRFLQAGFFGRDSSERKPAPGAPVGQSGNRSAIREWGRKGSSTEGLGIGRVSVRRVSGGRVSRRRLSREHRSVTPKPDRSKAGRSKPCLSKFGLSKFGLAKFGLSKWGWRRRRADSNRRIEVLQTSALATWLRRRPRILDPRIRVPRTPGPRTLDPRILDPGNSIGERRSGNDPAIGWSGTRDSNPRLQPWQGCTLPLS